MITFEQEERFEAYKILGIAFLIAFILNAARLAQLNLYDWPWANNFLFYRMASGFSLIKTYVHEFGHVILFWFYGYVAVPSWDFRHGGGIAPPLTAQLFILNLALYTALAYWFIQMRDNTKWRAIVVAIGIFHLVTAYFPIHYILILFAGHLGEVCIASICLIYTMTHTLSQDILKRYFVATIGSYIAVQSLIMSYALLFNAEYRHMYYNAKGQHGINDLDMVSDLSDIPFSFVVCFLLFLIVSGIVAPIISYIIKSRREERENCRIFLETSQQDKKAL